MTSRSALRVRQTSTAATVSCTPSKGIDRRRSLPRTAKVVAEVDGYQDQLMSPEKRQDRRRTMATATPATKISQKMATVLTFESPESQDENRRPSSRARLTKRSTARRLNLSSQVTKAAHHEVDFDQMDTEHDENIPPVGDTIGRRVSASASKRIVVRFRAVVPHTDGSVEYRTVGPESPWSAKRSPARVVSTRGSRFPRQAPTRKLSFEAEELESSSSEDYSSDESDEIECVSSDSELENSTSVVKTKSHVRQQIKFKTITVNSPEKRRGKGLQNPRMAVKKVETLEDFRRRLHTAEVPERMPCREEEAAEVERFIRNAISAYGTSSAMYISGVPGTGKTATVMSVVKHLSRDKMASKFCFVAVNAMEFIDPRKIFVEIYNQITGETTRISPASARKKLNAMFEMTDKCRPPIVILIDELDQLCTKKQELIYDIFNWTAVESARVSVMAIANTLDLPERMLSQRVTSRIGAARICFQPYEFQEIEQIIHDRLKGSTNAVDEGAVQIAARKVAAVTGDLRKAMDLLRRAIEIAIEKGAKKLLVEHAEKTEDFSFAELYAQYVSFAALVEGVAPLIESTLLSLIGQLCSTRLLVSSSGSHIPRRRLRLGMSYQDAQSAIKIRDNPKQENN
ncbi:ATPase, AAA family [Oesophagostomum dentatum]|uniref:Origin recognition complex subunit 1 n=1 Tax=Oesophagostomum dentatum TaxID=61180 RepID=A0A0B1TMZ9_OESDE|nr:ATPase, AAA family [Oesophagostomum dentatum]